MIWLQGGLSFLVWIAYGFIQSRRTRDVQRWARSYPRARRGLAAAGLMLGAWLTLFVALNVSLQQGGFRPGGMTPLTWTSVILFGLVFVHGQTLATALLVTMAQESVTAGRFGTYSSQGNQENDDDKASST